MLKHSVLVFCLEYLLRKEKPLLCIDTHAGAGQYALHEGFAAQSREWEHGLGKLSGGAGNGPLPELLRRYLELCFFGESGSGPLVYPGSPLIMARLMRPFDRLVCFELHPADYESCKPLLPGRAELRQTDGFSGLISLLPPPSRRGLVLIDPPYEMKDDYTRLPKTLALALRRFSTGTYIIWYPLFRDPPAGMIDSGELPEQLMSLYQGKRCRVELYTAGPGAASNSPRRMYGSGLVIYNPPWTLTAALEESLPVMGTLLGAGKDKWKMTAS